MIYRVLIVDDEFEIRQGLRLKANWESLQLEVIGEAANGAEALELLENVPVDIVLTDMSMPAMDGVSFLDACQEHYPELRIIVITGYEDFHYARAAIRNHALDYLLKPVSQSELTETLNKAVKELNDERNRRKGKDMIEWRISQYYKEMKENFINRLLKEEIAADNSRELFDRSRLFELDRFRDTTVRFVTTGIASKKRLPDTVDERTPDKLRMPFEMICREFAESHEAKPLVFSDVNYPGLMHLIVVGEDGVVAQEVTSKLDACITVHLAMTPIIAVGDSVKGLGQWKEGYLSSLLAWSQKESGIRQDDETASDQGATAESPDKLLKQYLSRGEMEIFRRTLHSELSSAFRESQEQFIKLIFQLYLVFDSLAHSKGIKLESRDQLWLRPDMALSLDTVEKAERFVLRLVEKIEAGSRKKLEGGDVELIQVIRQYIADNYMYEINLQSLAERYNYNPTYFSEWFKSKVGKTLIQYVTEMRMEHAMRLLKETDLNLWDIAELTGFSNASYFSSRFKRMYQISPSEVRNKPSEKSDNGFPKK